MDIKYFSFTILINNCKKLGKHFSMFTRDALSYMENTADGNGSTKQAKADQEAQPRGSAEPRRSTCPPSLR